MSEPTSDESMSVEPAAADLEPKRSWLTGKRLVGLALTVLILLRVAVELIPTPVIIGPETTFVDGPLRDDGTIDYAAALNDEWEAGVTPDQNAAVALLRAFGPRIVDEEIREAYFARLGIPIPPLEGDYLVEFREYLESQVVSRQVNADRFEELIEQQRSAQERPWTPNEFPEVAAWLDASQKPLEAILDAARRPRYFSPLVPPEGSTLLDALMPTEQKSRAAARLLMAHAMLELHRGDVERAFELTLACHRLARLVSEHPTLIGSLIAIALEAIATQGDAAIILDSSFTAEQATAFRQQIQALPSLRRMSDVFDRGERLVGLDSIVGMSQGRVEGTKPSAARALQLGLDPNPMLRLQNEVYDEIKAAFSLPDYADRIRTLDDLAQKLDKAAQWNRHRIAKMSLAKLFGSKATFSQEIGHLLIALTTPTFVQAAISENRNVAQLLLTDIGYSLAIARGETGEFPESLEALVPDQIDAVPLDPFTDDPLKYLRTDGGFLLYSVGPNGIDDGGLMDGRVSADDIAFGDTPDADE